jgi:hypothetical protein
MAPPQGKRPGMEGLAPKMGRPATGAMGKDWIKKEVEITYSPTDRHLVFYVPHGELRKRLAIKMLSKEDLMGELGPLANLHGFQLALPFTWNEWRVLRLCETLGTTT